MEVLSQGGREFQFKGAGEVGVSFGQHFRGLASGRKARMYGAAALQIAEPLPPVHAVELGFVPEGLQHSLVAASPLPHVDGGLEAAGHAHGFTLVPLTLLQLISVKMTSFPMAWCSREQR